MWPNKVKIMQKNWIGKSFGCEIDFKIKDNQDIKEIKCYTTDQILFWYVFFSCINVDHPIAKFMKMMIIF